MLGLSGGLLGGCGILINNPVTSPWGIFAVVAMLVLVVAFSFRRWCEVKELREFRRKNQPDEAAATTQLG